METWVGGLLYVISVVVGIFGGMQLGKALQAGNTATTWFAIIGAFALPIIAGQLYSRYEDYRIRQKDTYRKLHPKAEKSNIRQSDNLHAQTRQGFNARIIWVMVILFILVCVLSPIGSYLRSLVESPKAQCTDGSYSFSQTDSGTCSHHGGVSTWYN